ncbi:PTS sugar transporter subunit IIA [Tissierella sp. Yu-01]|uniref:PTS sugar transporter subunit IIA n=1 Tax=Tissierella sp. Yu-01 TaxID=3035694 RepID=UPI00240D9D24|nr:PTS sugar transporter subunit IIA [Tissierella sp. Yu-01]WFA08789.1 PTS sugar transporter subunit IIA [Tissierella sp. Yu-01]
MIGIILAGHGQFAKELLKSAQMIMGKQDNMVAFTLEPDDDPFLLKDRIYEECKKNDLGDGVIVLVDLMGGSPGNAAAYVAMEGYPVITGVNLPMLLELIAMRNLDIEEAVSHIIITARESIDDLRILLRG